MGRNIVSRLKPLRNLLKILGLLDFDIKYCQVQEKERKYYAYLYAVMDIIVTIVLLAYLLIFNPYIKGFTKTTFYTYASLAAIKCLTTNWRRLLKMEHIIKIWKEFQLIDSELTLLGGNTNLSGVKIITSLIVISFIGLRILQYLIHNIFDKEHSKYVLIMTLLFRVQDVALIAVVIEYLVYLLILQQYFDECSKLYEISYRNGVINRIRCFQKKYIELCQFTSRVLNTVAVPVIGIVCDASSILAVQLQGVLSRLYHSENTREWFYDAKYAALWCSASCLELFSIFITSYLCYRSANKMKQTLRRLNTTSINSSSMRNIKLFSLQILHEDFKIAPYDLFTIDLNLAYVIVGTLASYVVVITQFDIMYFK